VRRSRTIRGVAGGNRVRASYVDDEDGVGIIISSTYVRHDDGRCCYGPAVLTLAGASRLRDTLGDMLRAARRKGKR